MQCPNCGHANSPDARFCSQCGTKLELLCPTCSAPYEAGDRFCSQCGSGLPGADDAESPLAPATPAASPQRGDDDLARYVPEELLRKIRAAQAGQTMRGERRTVTMLFADIQGSTAAAESLDPEDWADIMNGAFGRLIEPVYRYEGTLARLQGDAILAFFGAPIAHEDDPVRAVRAGLDILAAIKPYVADVEQRLGVHIGVRVGINTGLVVVGEVGSDLRVEYTALGDAINVAARMEQTAEPGTVRVTQETLALTAGMFSSVAIGPVEVKGKAEPVLAHQVVSLAGASHDEPDLATPLVGRDAELATLTGLVERIEAGVGGICTLIGEAGIGKSRLLAAMRSAVDARVAVAGSWQAEGTLAWMRGRARSYERNVPHACFADLLCDWWGKREGDDCFDLLLDAVELATGTRDADLAGFLAGLVSAPLPDAQRKLIDSLTAPVLHERTTEAVATYLGAEARRRPIVLVLDDLHWADAMSLTLVERLMEVTESAPLAVVLVMRPNREDTAWRLVEAAARDHAHRHAAIELEALPADATGGLLAALLGETAVDDDVRREILERSNGNPLFIEEIVRSLGDASHGEDAGVRASVDVPASLTSLLTSRLDRLDESARHVAQVASVIGREFDRATLTAAGAAEGTDEAITELIRRGILEERRRVPEASYSFRHPLIRETAYSTVLLRTRRDLHGRIARHLEARTPEAVQEIARHYVEAGETVAAFPYLVEAGGRAIRAMALRDAISFYMAALESPPDEAEAELIRAAHDGLGEAYSLVPDLTHASAAYQSLLDFGRERGKPDIEVTALNRLGFSTAALAGDFDQAMVYLAQARALAEETGDEMGLAEYHMNACFVTSLQGDVARAVEHDSETARIGAVAGNQTVRLTGLVRKSANLLSILHVDEGLEAYEEALTVANDIGNDELVAVLECNVHAWALLCRGQVAEALAVLRDYLPVIDRYVSYYGVAAHQHCSEAARVSGDLELSLTESAATVRIGQSLGQPFGEAVGLSGRACVLAMLGLTDELADLRRRAIELLASPSSEFLATTVWADLGEAALDTGALPQARVCFETARDGSSVSAMWERPRVLLGLARVALAEGQLADARAALDRARAYIAEHELRVREPALLVVDGALTAAEGRDDDAAMLLIEADRAATESGQRLVRLEALGRLAALRARAGDANEADVLHDRARALIRELGGLIVDEQLRSAFLRRSEEVTAALVAATPPGT